VPPDDNPNNGLSAGAKAGLGSGVGVGVLVILLFVGAFVYRRRKRSKPGTTNDGFTKAELSGEGVKPNILEASAGGEILEKDSKEKTPGRVELPDRKSPPIELPAN